MQNKPFLLVFSFRLNTVSEVVKRYCKIANNAFVLPTRDDVIGHRVVITTLAMSKHLIELQLSHGFFTHILVDEAAQALEPEALIPLALAGPNTKVVFTGDHMQVGTELQHHQFRFILFTLFCYAVLFFTFSIESLIVLSFINDENYISLERCKS